LIFFALMVDAPRSPEPPPRVHAIDVFFYVDGGRSLISSIASRGPTIDVFCVDGECSGISFTASYGARCQHLFS
jgi:hypothetical protein